DGDRAVPPACATDLLPGGGDGARIADDDGGLQRADVDPELEGVRGDHAVDLPAAEPGLDLAPVQRQVPGAVAADPAPGIQPGQEGLLQVAGHDLHLQSRATEDDGLDAPADPGRRDPPPLEEGAAADAEVAVDQR